MHTNEKFRVFFVLYDNGETFYFNVNEKGEIHCREISKSYKALGINAQKAYAVEFTGNNFYLKSKTGETIDSLENFQQAMELESRPKLEGLYIDEEVRLALLASGKLKLDEEASQILGFHTEEDSFNLAAKPHSKTRHL